MRVTKSGSQKYKDEGWEELPPVEDPNKHLFKEGQEDLDAILRIIQK